MKFEKKKWIFAFLISFAIVLMETILFTISGISIKEMKDSLYIAIMMLLFASWFCIFAKDILPTYYDKNKINFVSQGIFRLHMVGLSFNNGNWPYVLTVFRIFTLATAILYPLSFYVSFRLGGIALWNTVKIVYLFVSFTTLIVATYIVGKKYE